MNEEELDKPMVSVASDDVPEDKTSLVARLKELSGRKFYNKSADMQATISGESAKKIARAESETITNLMRLGYTEAEASYIHRAAASKIGELYEQAVLFFEEEVYHKTDDRKAAWHFFEPVTVDLGDRNEAFLTNITVIDFTRGGERLFSLELTIENPISNAEGMAAPASGRQAQHPNGVSDVRIAAFESFVKKEKAQIERNAREKGLIPWRVDESRVNELRGEAAKVEKEIETLLAKFGGDEEKIQGFRRDRIKLHDLRERLAAKQAAIAAEYKPDSLPEVAQPIAPNGKPSHLSVDAWLMVRTKAFKAWFGDWENDPENASKAVDENGEPKVYYHHTNAEFTEFLHSKRGKTDAGWLGAGFYFYGIEDEGKGYGKNVMECFLNVREPYYASDDDMFRLSEADSIEESEAFTESLIEDGYDGVYYNGDLRQEMMVFEPNQIKSATDNRGTFDGSNPDITFSVVGPSAANWDKIKHRAFEGRDDGKLRVELDTSGVRLKKAPRHRTDDSVAKDLLRRLAVWRAAVAERGRLKAVQRAVKDEAWMADIMPELAYLMRHAAWMGLEFKSFADMQGAGLLELAANEEATLEDAKSAVKGRKVKGVLGYNKLGEVLDFPELYAAYPELRQMPVLWMDDKFNLRGSYAPEGERSVRKISVRANRSQGGILSTLLHEVQHWIQDKEGFAFGAAFDQSDYKRSAGEIEARNVQARRWLSAEERAELPFNETLAYPGEAISYTLNDLRGSFSVVNQDELDDIKAAAEKDGTFMKAPNGEPSKLTEWQWLQVRTKAFKGWFGDWERAAELTIASADGNFAAAKEFAKGLAGQALVNEDSGIVAYVNSEQRKELTHQSKARISQGNGFSVNGHFAVVMRINKLFRYAVRCGVYPDLKHGDPNVRIHRFACPIVIDGESAIAWMTAKETVNQKDSGRLYNLELLEINRLAGKVGDLEEHNLLLPPAASRDIVARLKELNKTYFEDISKVVDENGEPLVVYHGTVHGGFRVFDVDGRGKTEGTGAFFTSDKRVAEGYSANFHTGGVTPEVYACFLNIREPHEVDFHGNSWNRVPDRAAGYFVHYDNGDSEWFSNKADADFAVSGYEGKAEIEEDWEDSPTLDDLAREVWEEHPEVDGIIAKNVVDTAVGASKSYTATDFIVASPNQVKSATDNRGTFDGSNPDITFSVIGTKAKTWDRYKHRAFTGRDDGMLRAEIDASQAKLTPRAFLGDAGDEYRLLVAGKAMPFGLQDDLEKLREQQKLIDEYYHILFETDDIDKAEAYSAEHGMTKEWHEAHNELRKGVRDFVIQQLQLAGVRGEGKYGSLTKMYGRFLGLIMTSIITGKVNEDVAAELDKMSGGNMKCLKDVLDYEELYEAYPDLKWLPVSVADLGYELRGQLTVKGDYPDSIMLNERLDNEGRRSTLLHEIQHAIQTIEEFARGGTSEMASKLLEKQVRQYRMRLELLRKEQRWLYAVDTAKDHLERMLRLYKRPRAILKMGERFAVHEMQHVPTMAAQAIEMMWKEYTEIAMRDYGDSVAYAPGDGYRLPGHGDKKATLVAVEELLEKLKALPSRRAGTLRGRRQKVEAEIERLYEENKHKLNMTDMSGSELYLRLAGEIEARNVQHRMDWSADKRAAIPFNETLEYPGEALVTFSTAHVPLYNEILDTFYQRIAKDGRAVWASRVSGEDSMRICAYPEVLNMIIPWKRDVIASRDVVQKLMNKHGLLPQDVAKLPQALWNPVAVFEEPNVDKGFIVITDILAPNFSPKRKTKKKNKGQQVQQMKSVMAVLELRTDANNAVITEVVSAYSADSTEKYKKLIEDGFLRYADTERALTWASAEGDSVLQLLTTALLHSGSGVMLKDRHPEVNTNFTASVVRMDEERLVSDMVAAGGGFKANVEFTEKMVKEMRNTLQRLRRLSGKTRTDREDAIAAMGSIVHMVKAVVQYLPKGYRFSVHPYLNKLETLAEMATSGDIDLTEDIAPKEVAEMEGSEGLDRGKGVDELVKEFGNVKLVEALERIINRVNEQLRKHAKDRTVEKITELMERLAPKKDAKTGKLKGGKMSADAYRDLEDVAIALGMDEDDLKAKLDGLNAQLAAPGLTEEQRAVVESQIAVYDQFGNLKAMTPEEALAAYESLRQRVWLHRFEWDNIMAEKRAARRAVINRVVDGVGAVSDNEYNTAKRVKKVSKRVKSVGNILSNMPQVLHGLSGYLPLQNLARDMALRANMAGEKIKAWESERWAALEVLSKKTLKKSWRLCMDDMHKVQGSGVTFRRPKYRTVSVRTEALRELLAMTPQERRAEMKLRREAGGLVAETVLSEKDIAALQSALEKMEKEGRELSRVETKYISDYRVEENLKLSKGEALYAILMFEQPTYTERLMAQGYTEEVIAGLKEYIGEGMLEFGYGMRELFAIQGDRIAAVYEGAFGVPFPREENYFAARWVVNGMKETAAEQLLAGMMGTPGAGNGWQKQRVDHNLELDMTKDALQVFLQATKLTDTWMATQDIVADFKAWTRDSEFERALTVLIGKDNYDNLKDWIRILEMGGVQDCLNMGAAQDVINGLYGSGAVAILGFRLQTLVRQVPAVFNGLLGAHDISTGEWLATLARMKHGEAPMTFKRMVESALMKNRQSGKDGAMAGQSARPGDMQSSLAEDIMQASMRPMEWVDARCTALSLVPVWNVYYARAVKSGASHEEAEQAAWEQTALVANMSSQPVGFLNKSKIAQLKNPLVKTFFYMLSENMAKVSMCQALWKSGNKKAALRGWLFYGAANAAISALLDCIQGDPEEWEKAELWEYVLSAFYGPLASMPGIGEAVAALGTGFLKGLGYAFDDEELQKARTHAGAARAIFDVEGAGRAVSRMWEYLTDDEEHGFSEYSRELSKFSRTLAIGTGWLGNAVGYWSTVVAVCLNPVDLAARMYRNFQHYYGEE